MAQNPTFGISDDYGNPITNATNKLIKQAADAGLHRGDSRSVDAEQQKYPKGFTLGKHS